VPGKTFAGLRLGATRAQVQAAWGARHGVCRSCKRTTWYFNEKPFEAQGAGVEFENGRAVAFFTLWQPTGWRTREGVRIGDPEARVSQAYGALQRTACGSYDALRLRRHGVDTYLYIRSGRVWGLGLSRAAAQACR
jgi:hypothetical protein